MTDKYIDIHAHIYPDPIAAKAVKAIENFYDIIQTNYQDGTAAGLVRICQRAGVVKAVVHSVATSPRQVESINNFIAEAAASNPMFIPFATLHPDMSAEAVRAECGRIKGLGMRGIKLHPDFQRFDADGKEAVKLFSNIDEDLPVMIHSGDKRYTFSTPKRIISIAKRFPQLRFIAAHFGGYSEWEYAEGYIETPNVYFDTSSSLAFLEPQRAAEIINCLGVERFMFGTDYPMWSADDEIIRVKKLGLSEEDEDKIFYHNAAGFFGLE
jgi:predicted TIM-barrel fold metal-dependent hydrolase